MHTNSEAPIDQTITLTWAIGVGLSGQWPVPHKKTIISHVEVISLVAEATKLVPQSIHCEFYFHNYSDKPTGQTITSTCEIVVRLSRQWPVPHKEAIFSHVELISLVAEALKLVPLAIHWEFYFHDYSDEPTDQTITSTWAIRVGISRQWPVPHKKAIISHVEVIYLVAEASKLLFLQQCIENFTSMAIPKPLLTRWSLQHEQLRWD